MLNTGSVSKWLKYNVCMKKSDNINDNDKSNVHALNFIITSIVMTYLLIKGVFWRPINQGVRGSPKRLGPQFMVV